VDSNGNPTVLIDRPFFNTTDRPFYKAATAAGTQVWSPIVLIPPLSGFGLVSAAPLFINGTQVAVVGSELDLTLISQFLATQQFGKTGSAMILKNGLLVASSKPDSGVTMLLSNGTLARLSVLNSPVGAFSATAEELLHRYGSLSNLPQSQFSYSGSAGSFFVTVTPIVEANGINWDLVIMIPRSDWFGSLDRATWINLGVVLGCLAISIVVAVMWSIWVNRPLRRMEQMMNKISKDVSLVEEKPKASRVKEVSQLQRSFARLQYALASFLRYVPVDVVRMLVQYCAEPVIGVEQHYVTLFFSDIADFTTISEQTHPCQLIHLLCEYLDMASDSILTSKGTLADFIGDAVFAFWNAPTEVEKHPAVACESALFQQECLAKLNSQWTSQGLPNFKVRMGIHTGNALCGNIGSNSRMKFTAIGDSVNLASRLENLNKRYDTKILITEEVFSQVKEDFLCRPLDIVSVKGRTSSTWIFELVCRMKDATPEQKSVSITAHTAWTLYLSRRFGSCLEELRKLPESDVPASLLKERCLKYIQSPPPADWSGVDILTEK